MMEQSPRGKAGDIRVACCRYKKVKGIRSGEMTSKFHTMRRACTTRCSIPCTAPSGTPRVSGRPPEWPTLRCWGAPLQGTPGTIQTSLSNPSVWHWAALCRVCPDRRQNVLMRADKEGTAPARRAAEGCKPPRVCPDNAAFSGSACMMPPSSRACGQDRNVLPVCISDARTERIEGF